MLRGVQSIRSADSGFVRVVDGFCNGVAVHEQQLLRRIAKVEFATYVFSVCPLWCGDAAIV